MRRASIWVTVDARRLIVFFDDTGEPLRIKERKTYGKPPHTGFYDLAYWSAKHHKIGGPETRVSRVLEAAKAALDATP